MITPKRRFAAGVQRTSQTDACNGKQFATAVPSGFSTSSDAFAGARLRFKNTDSARRCTISVNGQRTTSPASDNGIDANSSEQSRRTSCFPQRFGSGLSSNLALHASNGRKAGGNVEAITRRRNEQFSRNVYIFCAKIV